MGAPSSDATLPVVSNTTPLVALAGVDLLHLLPSLYTSILIPQAVHDEYQTGWRLYPGTRPDLDTLAWVMVRAITADAAVTVALDVGEAQAITLAIATHARIILLDERKARSVASKLGLPVVGTLTVLLAAKQQGLLPAVRSVIDQMMAQGRRISPQLRTQVLEVAGE